jgi:uncharacterized protein (TIGR02246 family)
MSDMKNKFSKKSAVRRQSLSIAILAAAFVCAGCFGCSSTSEDSAMSGRSEDVRAIEQLAADWRSAWLTGDTDALLSLYADQPVLMPQGQPAVMGKEAIRSLYQSVLKEYEFRSEGKVMEVEASGDWGYFWSTYTLTATPKAGGKPLTSAGKTVFIVKRQPNGAWKIARLIDNSDGESAD